MQFAFSSIVFNTKMRHEHLYLTATFFLWGSLYVASKIALAEIPPLTVLMLRYSFAVLFLFLACFRNSSPIRTIKKQNRSHFLFIGLAGYFGAIIFQLLGTRLLTSSTSALVNSLNPITIPICAAIFLQEKITYKMLISIFLSVCGVVVIIGTEHGVGNPLGILFGLISVTLWSITAVAIKKISKEYAPQQIAFYGMIIALLPAIPLAVIESCSVQYHISLKAFGAVVYMAVFCTAIAQTLWNKCLGAMNAAQCSAFYPLQAVFSALLGFLILEETVTHRFIWGTLLVSVGILLSVAHIDITKRPLF